MEPDVVEDIEAFTCVMYGQAHEKSVNNVRSIMLKKIIGEDETVVYKKGRWTRDLCMQLSLLFGQTGTKHFRPKQLQPKHAARCYQTNTD